MSSKKSSDKISEQQSESTQFSEESISQDSSFSFPEMEKKILDFWQEEQIFERSLEQTRQGKPYIFYDGPPFATGLPHHGHLVGSILKDIVPRYFTMLGRYVDRRFGWDCHGLPIEHEIDKKLQMSAHDAVAKLGVAGYNQECRQIVQRYVGEWETTIKRIGRWVDFKRDYKTMDASFMESVWWAFRQLWDKSLIYKGTKVVPYSTALGTVLSNFEASQNYQDVQDPAVTVLFRYDHIRNNSHPLHSSITHFQQDGEEIFLVHGQQLLGLFHRIWDFVPALKFIMF